MSSDPDLYAWVLSRGEFGHDVSQSILPAMGSLFSISDFREFHIQIIWDHEDIGSRVEFIEIHHTRDSISREVHEGHRLHEDDIFCFRDDGMKSRVFPLASSESFSHVFDGKKSHIVSGVFVFFPRIAESDYDFH